MKFKQIYESLMAEGEQTLAKVFASGKILVNPSRVNIENAEDADFFGVQPDGKGNWIATKKRAKGAIYKAVPRSSIKKPTQAEMEAGAAKKDPDFTKGT